MKGIAKNNDLDSLVKERDKSLYYLQQLAEKTVIEANKLAEKIKQEAQSEAAKIMGEVETAQKEAAKVMGKVGAAQKEAAKVMEEAAEKARKVISEAQGQADNKMTEANELAERIKQEAQSEAVKIMGEVETARKEAVQVMEEAEAAQKEANAIIEALRKQILDDVEIIRNRFLPSLENISAGIAEGGATIKKERATLKVVEKELEASAPCAPTSGVEGNGHKVSLEAEANLESEFATMAVASGQTGENTVPVDFVDKSVAPPSSLDVAALFDGEIEIAILPPVDIAQLIQLRRELLDTPYLKILRTAGSWNEGSVITVVADKALPLISMLMKISAVEKVELWAGEEGGDGDFPWNLTLESKTGNCQRKRLLVTLKKEPR